MNITFLGTGTSQGIPVIGSDHPVCLSEDPRDKRLRVSVLLSWDDYNYVIDCGPDFRQQMLTTNVSKLDGILFTHEHADHTAGIDDIRPFFFRQGDIPIYAHERVAESLKTRFDYIFANEDRYPGAPAVEVNIIQNNIPFVLGGQMVVPINAHHNRLQVFGFRINGFTYLTDVKTVDDEEIEKIKGSNILVVNALRKKPHHSHFNLKEALEFIEKVNPKKAYLSHISHLLGFHEEVEKELPNNVHLAYDNLQLSL
ncbi:MBL fold metallo-hydrolase [Maribacter sp. HTCC2170]|uniref:MBL fold metallo-hydrolase n=1 Tax=Maribacter sp. (strain HTCC2170 / KCCM 42371) TaxID=313603 RepID=UPI00006B21C7|nr:MBL fold metallo-hydrolase [Maribacter sp. HTCC2170]EAR00268.1 putative hydrolase [Maribacter sp. HTCC2170]